MPGGFLILKQLSSQIFEKLEANANFPDVWLQFISQDNLVDPLSGLRTSST
jgi:hypothetical protein